MSTLIDAIEKLELDTAFVLDSVDGDTITIDDRVTMPKLVTGDGQPAPVINEGARNWMVVSGLSNQEGYTGPILHPSEQLSEDIITEIRERERLTRNPSGYHLIWALCEITDPQDPDALVGWALALTIEPDEPHKEA